MARKVVDPVCKMKVDPERAPAKAEYKGKTYYFCAPGCKEAFVKNPERYVREEGELKSWWNRLLRMFKGRR